VVLFAGKESEVFRGGGEEREGGVDEKGRV